MPTPEEINERTRAFLREHPDAETALSSLLDRDETDSWTFDDIALDSGRFGELVSRDLVEKTADGGYRLHHPDAIEAALEGESIESTGPATAAALRSRVSMSVSPRELGGLLGALALVVGARVLAYNSVFRDGNVVSPGNDPYFYRYWQEQLLARSDGVTDLGLLADMGGAANSRPLTHAVNWWLAELLGGTPEAAATVAAWLPVVGAVTLGCVLYALAKVLTDDVRVGLAAVAFLGVAPVHVVYTNVGFLEHRLHQYLWLGVLALALTWLAVDLQRRRETVGGVAAARGRLRASSTWAAVVVLALAVGASAHIWGGSPLTFIPVAIYVALRVVMDVRADVPPLLANAPAIVGLASGSVLALGMHLGLGWHEPIAVLAPISVTVGALAVAGLAEGWRRMGWPSTGLLATEALVGILGLAGFWILQPVSPERLTRRLGDLFFREGATEAGTLFATEQAVLLGPLWQIGISFYFGLAVLAVVTALLVRRYEPGWLLSVCFAWYYLFLAALQSRFAAQLVIFISLFAGVGVVYLLFRVELARSVELFDRSVSETSTGFEIPRGRKAGYLVGTIALLLVFNLIFVPTLVGQTTYSDEQYEAALAIDAHAANAERTYPETAVETGWSEIRMYNYFVNGESSSYNSRYDRFMTADHPDDQYNRLRNGGRYVVINELDESPPGTYEILFEGLGVGYGDVETTAGRYQPVYVGDSLRAFTVVEGAVLNVTGADGSSVTAATTVEIDGESVSYERHGTVENGHVEIRVAHPGEYTVAGETVTVSEAAVHEGAQLDVRLE